MSIAPSHMSVSASQVGHAPVVAAPQNFRVNYFIVPIFVLETIGVACLWALFYYLRFTDVFPYHQRVFHCNDMSLQYPNFRARDFLVYVSETTLYCVAFMLPPLIIIIGEFTFWLFSTKPRKTVYACCFDFKVPVFVRRVLRFIAVFLFGALITCIFTDTIKLITGYQRPYFLTLCNPDPQQCRTRQEAPSFSPEKEPRIACRELNDWELRYAWLTFPSMHAALSSFAAVFASLYIHYMVRLRGAPLLRPFLIAGFLGMSLIASFSVIQGYKAHWVDVWVGWLIGLLWAFYLCHNVLCFQEIYRLEQHEIVDEREAPIFSWFKIPRVSPPSTISESVEEFPVRKTRKDKQYDVTTTTESFTRTILPPGTDPQKIGLYYQ